jgi:hypothetical protein
MNQQFEYRMLHKVRLDGTPDYDWVKEIIEGLNELGRQEWEIVDFKSGETTMWALFKRVVS